MEGIFCQEVSIRCGAGTLQGRIQYREENQGKPGVILCPPHPLLAGNIDNNVITALEQRLAEQYTVLAFNYRNVGQSFRPEGDLPLFEYWDRLDQKNDFSVISQDSADVLDWSSRFFSHFHLIGYSFGAFIALSILRESALSLSCIAPPLAEHVFDFSAMTCPSLVVFAGLDDLARTGKTGVEHARVETIKDGDHFFRGQEDKVCQVVAGFLGEQEAY